MFKLMTRAACAALISGAFCVPALAQSAAKGKPPEAKAYHGAEVFTTTSELYGRIEFRMLASKGSGVLSNFFTWKDGSEQSGVFWEEVDIEVFGKDNTQSWQSNIISGGRRTTHSEQVHSYPYSFGDEYHTYAIEWTPDELVWFVDGVETRRTSGGQASDIASPAQLRFNTWVSSSESWVGPFDDAVLPRHMFVSWVKYYRYDGGQFVLDWEDSFESWNPRWQFADWTFDGNLVQFDPANAGLSNGKLVLSITHAGQTGYDGTALADPEDNNPEGAGENPNEGGPGGPEPCADGTPVTDPGDISITSADGCSVGLAWVASPQCVAGYNIYANGQLAGTSTAPSYTVTGLTPRTFYNFDVRAFDDGGNLSAPSSAQLSTKKRCR